MSWKDRKWLVIAASNLAIFENTKGTVAATTDEGSTPEEAVRALYGDLIEDVREPITYDLEPEITWVYCPLKNHHNSLVCVVVKVS